MSLVAQVRAHFEALYQEDDGHYRSTAVREAEWIKFAVGYFIGLQAGRDGDATAVADLQSEVKEWHEALQNLCGRIERLEGHEVHFGEEVPLG